MGPVFFVMAIMGCGDGATMCEQVAREPSVYQSQESCYEQTDAALIRASDQPYPMIMAECREVSPNEAASLMRGMFRASSD